MKSYDAVNELLIRRSKEVMILTCMQQIPKTIALQTTPISRGPRKSMNALEDMTMIKEQDHTKRLGRNLVEKRR